MELTDMSVPARVVSGGRGEFEMVAGKTLKIETSPQGLNILNEQVPEGERWRVVVNVQIDKFAV